MYVFFFQAEDGIRDSSVTGVQTCALPISSGRHVRAGRSRIHLWKNDKLSGAGARTGKREVARAFDSPRLFSAMDAALKRHPLLVTALARSEEHTSELQSHLNLVCRLLLEKKKAY